MRGSKDNSERVMRHLLLAFLALLLVFAIGTAGYHWLGKADVSWLDCFFMTFITISTIGYSEIVDVSHYEYGRLFTVFVAVAGIGVLGYTLSTLTAFMLENDLNKTWRRKKMQQQLNRTQDHYIVCGIGFIGSNVVQELAATGRPSVVVDPDLDNIELLLQQHPDQLYICGDATDDEVLQRAGIANARGLFAVVSDDSQNLMICLGARQLNPKLRIVARCHDPKNMEKLKKVGADEAISPDYSGGVRIASAMLRPSVQSFLDDMIKSDENVRLEEVTIPTGLSGKPLATIYHDNQDCIVLALRQSGVWLFNPNAQQTLASGDVLMVMTTTDGRNRLTQLIVR